MPTGVAASASARRGSAKPTGNTVEQEQPAEPSSERLTEFIPVSAAPAALQERAQVGPVSVSCFVEPTGNAEQEQPAPFDHGKIAVDQKDRTFEPEQD